MTRTVHMIAEDRFEGDLSLLARDAHVWVALTVHNVPLYDRAVACDRRESSPDYGLSGFPVEGSMVEAVQRFLGTIHEHHDDPLWDEIRIHGLSASQLDPARVQEVLSTKVTLTDDGEAVVVTRSG